MNTPSTRGMKVLPQEFLPEWRELQGLDLINAMEQWAAANMRPQSAAVGTYTAPAKRSAAEPTLVTFWIVRRNDYDTGRANVEIQLRKTSMGNTYIQVMKEDEYMWGTVTDFHMRTRHQRALLPSGELGWVEVARVSYETPEPKNLPPFVRVPELLRQCWDLGKELSEWLANNTVVIEKDADEPTNIRPALTEYMRHNLMFFALDESAHQAAKDALNDPTSEQAERWRSRRGMAVDYHRLLTDLRRSDRIATPEHYALYERLMDSVQYVREQPHPSERPINISNLLGLQTRWVNEFRELLKPFLKH